jgi:hypothetical protein
VGVRPIKCHCLDTSEQKIMYLDCIDKTSKPAWPSTNARQNIVEEIDSIPTSHAIVSGPADSPVFKGTLSGRVSSEAVPDADADSPFEG